MKAFALLLLLAAVWAMKRSAPESNDSYKPSRKRVQVVPLLDDLILPLPTEIFDFVLIHVLRNQDKSLSALASTCWDCNDKVTDWSLRYVHTYTSRIPDKNSEILTPLVLPLVKELYHEEDTDDIFRTAILADVFLGLATQQNIGKIIGLINELDPSEGLRNKVSERIFELMALPLPFASAEPLIDMAWEIFCAGIYRVGFACVFLGGSKTFPLLSSIIDLFIADHFAKNHDAEPYILFIQAIMEHLPELWNRKVQLLEDIISVFQMPGEEMTENYPIIRAIKELSSETIVLKGSEQSEVVKRILERSSETGELYLYSMILSAINSDHVSDPETYAMQIVGLTGNVLPYMVKFSDACNAVFEGLEIQELSSWNWQMRDLVRAVISNRMPHLTKLSLFNGYLNTSSSSTAYFTSQCFKQRSKHFENLLIKTLDKILGGESRLWETFNYGHLRHISRLLNTLRVDAKNAIEKRILSILADEYVNLIATNDPNSLQSFTAALQNNPEFQSLAITAIKMSPTLNNWTSLWNLVNMFPALEGQLKSLMIN